VSQLLELQVCRCSYAVGSMLTNICLDSCDPKVSSQGGVCEVYRVRQCSKWQPQSELSVNCPTYVLGTLCLKQSHVGWILPN